jgi:ADP-heptose:LPS heptosyltransferase
MKLIFFSTDQIGDAILANILLDFVAKKVPNAEIYVFNKNHCHTKSLFQENENIREISTVSTRIFSLKSHKSFWYLCKIVKNSPKNQQIYITSLLGSKTIFIALLPILAVFKVFGWNIKIFGMKPYSERASEHIISHHIRQFERNFGVKFANDDNNQENFLQKFIGNISKKQPKTIAILAGASILEKTLPAEKFAKIIMHFAGEGFKIKLLGSKSAVDQHQVSEIMRIINGRVPVYNLAGNTDLKGYFSEIASAEYVITNDSSGQHIANALGTPCGVLWARHRENSIVKAYSWQNAITANIFGEMYFYCKKCSILMGFLITKPHCKRCIRENYSKMDENAIILQIEEHLSCLRTLQKIS